MTRQPGERFVGANAFQLARLAVLLVIADVVASDALGHRFDERRAVAGTAAIRGFGDRGCHRPRVVAVDTHAGDAVRTPTLVELIVRHDVGKKCQLRIAVVLAHEDHRKLARGSEVQGFAHRPLVHRPVAEHRQNHRAALHTLRGERCSASNGGACPDDAVLAVEGVGDIGQVRAAAATAVDSGLPAEQFCEQRRERRAARKGPAVTPVGREHRVAPSQCHQSPDGDGFLADLEMHAAGDVTRQAQVADPLFEAADREHRLVEIEILHPPGVTLAQQQTSLGRVVRDHPAGLYLASHRSTDSGIRRAGCSSSRVTPSGS